MLMAVSPGMMRGDEPAAGYVEFATRQGTGVLTREPDNGKAPGKTQKFPFDHVLGESSTQEDVFAGKDLIAYAQALKDHTSITNVHRDETHLGQSQELST